MKVSTHFYRGKIEQRRRELGGDTYAHAKPRNATRVMTMLKIRVHDLETLLDVYEAALEYARSEHTFDANCAAGECDSCTARVALEKLERLVGGPEGGHAFPGKKVV